MQKWVRKQPVTDTLSFNITTCAVHGVILTVIRSHDWVLWLVVVATARQDPDTDNMS